MSKTDRINKAQEKYEAALAQVQAAPTAYTKRELKRADQARKSARYPTWVRVIGPAMVGVFVLVVFISCGANAAATQAEVERCLGAAEAAGWDSNVPAIQNACADPESRQRILSEEGE